MKITLSIALSFFVGIQSFSQTLDEIVAKHIEAIGGKDNWEKIKTLKMESSVKIQGSEIKTSTQQVDKIAMRQDITLLGMTGYLIVTNTEGWSFMPFQGQTKPEPFTGDDLKMIQEELYIHDAFITYVELGKIVDYLGQEDVDGVECYKIKMTGKDGHEITYYIDPDNYYIIKRTDKIMANGQEFENSVTFGNFKKLEEGIIYPMNSSGDFGESEIQEIELNAVIDDNVFKIPE